MTVLCDNYVNGIEEQPGDQPIRVFYPYFKNAFGNIVNEMWHSRKIDFSSLRFQFVTENIPCIGPSCTTTQIQIHDSFMSMLWGINYGILVKAPFRNDGTEDERHKAESLLDYSLGLLTRFSNWDKWNLPNPELHDRDPKQLIGKSNSVFWYAYNFILYHEFAHLVLGHFDTRRSIDKLAKEFEADNFAYDYIINKIKGNSQEMSGKTGILSALCSILFCSYDVSSGSLHPDPHHRLISVLEKMGSDGDKSIWGTAIWFVIEWGMKFNAFWKLWPGNFNGDFKDAFYQSLNYLEHLQTEREVEIPSFDREYTEGESVVHLENSVTVTIVRKFISRNKHYNTYEVQFASGTLIYVSSDDICREGSDIHLKAKEWKEEMTRRGEKSISIGLDVDNNFHCFYHTSNHYQIKKDNPMIRFKWAWGQPSY